MFLSGQKASVNSLALAISMKTPGQFCTGEAESEFYCNNYMHVLLRCYANSNCVGGPLCYLKSELTAPDSLVLADLELQTPVLAGAVGHKQVICCNLLAQQQLQASVAQHTTGVIYF